MNAPAQPFYYRKLFNIPPVVPISQLRDAVQLQGADIAVGGVHFFGQNGNINIVIKVARIRRRVEEELCAQIMALVVPKVAVYGGRVTPLSWRDPKWTKEVVGVQNAKSAVVMVAVLAVSGEQVSRRSFCELAKHMVRTTLSAVKCSVKRIALIDCDTRDARTCLIELSSHDAATQFIDTNVFDAHMVVLDHATYSLYTTGKEKKQKVYSKAHPLGYTLGAEVVVMDEAQTDPNKKVPQKAKSASNPDNHPKFTPNKPKTPMGVVEVNSANRQAEFTPNMGRRHTATPYVSSPAGHSNDSQPAEHTPNMGRSRSGGDVHVVRREGASGASVASVASGASGASTSSSPRTPVALGERGSLGDVDDVAVSPESDFVPKELFVPKVVATDFVRWKYNPYDSNPREYVPMGKSSTGSG